MLRDFNILATTERVNESAACSELWTLLRAVGDAEPAVDRMGVWGIVAARTSLDPLEATASITRLLSTREKSAKMLLRVMPVQRVVATGVDSVAEAAVALSHVMGPGDTYRITVEKRRTKLASMELIDPIAERLLQKVKLVDPDWVVLVETVGRLTGVSVVPPSGILNVQKLNARLAAQAKKGAALD